MCDPYTYENAHGQLKWENDMAKEYNSLMKNKALEFVVWPQGKNVVKRQWVYKVKFTS
jgi:hypothetical protein